MQTSRRQWEIIKGYVISSQCSWNTFDKVNYYKNFIPDIKLDSSKIKTVILTC